MARRAYDVKAQPYKGIDVEKIAREQVFAAAKAGQNQWKDNLEKGVGATGTHRGRYVSTGDAVRSINTSPQTEGHLDYEVGSELVQVAIAEFGRTPAWPPFDPDDLSKGPIADWIHRTNGLPNRGDPDFENTHWNMLRYLATHRLAPFNPGLKAADDTRRAYQEAARRAIENDLHKQKPR